MRRISTLFVSGLLLLACFYWVDWSSIVTRLLRLDVAWVALGVLAGAPLVMLSAARWMFTSAQVGSPLPFRTAVAEYYRSFLLNQVLPFGILGDVIRAGRQAVSTESEREGGIRRAALSVGLERASGQMVLFLLLLFSAPLWWSGGQPSPSFAGATSSMFLIAAGGLLVGLLLAVFGRGLYRRWLSEQTREEVRAALLSPSALLLHVGLSSAVLFVLLIQFFLICRAMGLILGWEAILLLALPMLAASALPFTMSGWGAREAAAAAVFSAAEFSSADGIAVGVAFGVLQLLSAAPALVFFAFPSLGRPAKVQG